MNNLFGLIAGGDRIGAKKNTASRQIARLLQGFDDLLGKLPQFFIERLGIVGLFIDQEIIEDVESIKVFFLIDPAFINAAENDFVDLFDRIGAIKGKDFTVEVLDA